MADEKRKKSKPDKDEPKPGNKKKKPGKRSPPYRAHTKPIALRRG